jgi:lipoteichoic acid synthase
MMSINCGRSKRLKRFNDFFMKRSGLGIWCFAAAFIFIKTVYFQFTTGINGAPLLSPINIIMLLSSAAVILLMIGLLRLIPSARIVIVLLALDLAISVVLAFDINFYRYYYNPVTLDSLKQFDIKVLPSINTSIFMLFRPLDGIILIDFPFLIWFIVLAARKLGKDPDRVVRFRPLVPVVLILTGSLFVIAANMNYASSKKNTGILSFHAFDIGRTLLNRIDPGTKVTPADSAAFKAFFDARDKEYEGMNIRYKGLADGRNLIVIQMESVQGFLINAKINGREITPNLNRIANESMYFSNIYFQVAAGNTSDAEFVFNTSLYPLYTGSVYFMKAENTYLSLPKAVKTLGYYAMVQHAYDPIFWNRPPMYKALGFDKFYDKSYFIMDDLAGWNWTALSDRSFFRQAVNRQIPAPAGSNYYNFMISLTNHSPYLDFAKRDFDVGKYEGTFLGNFMKSANFADECVATLVDELKANGLYDNAVIVLYGDHAAITRLMSKELFDFTGVEDNEANWIKLQKVPFILRCPGLPQGVVMDGIGGCVDILPTVANLLNIRGELPYMTGKDLLNTNLHYANLRNGAVVTQDFIYSSNAGQIFDYSTGEPLAVKDFKNAILKYSEEVRISDLILKKNLLKEIP